MSVINSEKSSDGSCNYLLCLLFVVGSELNGFLSPCGETIVCIYVALGAMGGEEGKGS